MNRNRTILTAVLGLALTLAMIAPADAGDFAPGTGFQAGGVYFHVVSVSPQSGTLFRVAERLPGHSKVKHSGCYRVGRTFYHPESCSALRAHLQRYGYFTAGAGSTTTAQRSYGTGSHPIDYVRGSYVEPDRSYDRAYAGLFYGAWLAPGARRGGLHGGRGFGLRGGRGRFAGFAGSRSFGISIGPR